MIEKRRLAAEAAKIHMAEMEDDEDCVGGGILAEISREVKAASREEKPTFDLIEGSQTAIQDHPCLFYTRRFTNKKVILK